ncbi:cache domain-containing protein [Chitinimonas lacunae]|uniref:histidine kinase n=1 Tax=Chitinimonas lacunae TaxID=1963018 RepID=A0ABV8MQ90_9NEIS
MKFKYKIVALTVLPLLCAVLVIGLLVHYQAQRMVEQQAALIEEDFLAAKRIELAHYVEMANSLIEPLYRQRNDEEAKRQVKAILQALDYGDDGYFFVYDLTGRNLVHPRQPELVGRNLWNLTDAQGRYVIRSLLDAARRGEGYRRYSWRKPSTRQVAEKLSYVVLIPGWDWMIGTGLYLDDIDRATAQARERAAANVRATLWGLAAVALVAVLLVCAAGFALNVSESRLADGRLKVMAQRIVSLQEAERARVSRELHDGISQLLVSVKFQFELAQHRLEQGHPGAAADLAKGLAGLSDAIGEVRRISHDLRPSVLDSFGLPIALAQLADEFSRRTGMPVELSDTLGEQTVPDTLAVALFRIAQEALTNIERHASANSVRIELTHADRIVTLALCDDGRGFNPSQLRTSGGIGLRNIRERIEHLGGRVDLCSLPGATRLAVSVPLSEG